VDSTIGKKWLEKIPLKKSGFSFGVKEHRKFTMEMFNQLWNAYNFSLRELIGLMTFNLIPKEVFNIVNGVYNKLQSKGLNDKM
jgi:hypothetical protein